MCNDIYLFNKGVSFQRNFGAAAVATVTDFKAG